MTEKADKSCHDKATWVMVKFNYAEQIMKAHHHDLLYLQGGPSRVRPSIYMYICV
jgi:hypothetical protein